EIILPRELKPNNAHNRRYGNDKTKRISTKNIFGIFAECLIQNAECLRQTRLRTKTQKHKHAQAISLTNPRSNHPIYIHDNVNYPKLLEALKIKYNNRFHAKYTSEKLKNYVVKKNIQFHTCMVSNGKFLTVVLKGLIKLSEKTIISNIKSQGLNPLNCKLLFSLRLEQLLQKLTKLGSLKT
ncbi:unnamed protein product, partial [Heterotrigona itama]